MHILRLTIFFFSLSIIAATSGSVVARNDITDNVLELTVHNYHAKSLRKRKLPLAPTQEDLLSTRFAYIANVTVAGQDLALVLDTGSEKTWVRAPSFICMDYQAIVQPQSECMFGRPFDTRASTTLPLEEGQFEVKYGNSEFLQGHLAREQISIGGVSRKVQPHVTAYQTIGIAEQGYWLGDKVSSGVLGLAFPSSPNRFSVIQTLVQERSTAPIFSLALNRISPPTSMLPALPSQPEVGGVLAFGGIPNVPTDDRWVDTPLVPVPSSQGKSHLYTIRIDGFDITPPSASGSSPLHTRTEGGLYIFSRQIMAIDSGATTVDVPPEVAAYTASLFVPRARQYRKGDLYIVPCTAKAPRVGIKIAGTSYYISHADLISPAPEIGDNMCQLELYPSRERVLLLGTPWLKNVLVAFDFTSMREGDGSRKGVVSIAGRKSY